MREVRKAREKATNHQTAASPLAPIPGSETQDLKRDNANHLEGYTDYLS
jgi:hypothetical protein